MTGAQITTFEGKWWIPGNEEQVADGTVRLEEDGTAWLTLDSVEGSWFGTEEPGNSALVRIPVVHGETRRHGSPITLLQCRASKLGFPPGLEVQELDVRVPVVVDGALLESEAELWVDRMKLRLGWLHVFAQETALRPVIVKPEANHRDTPLGSYTNLEVQQTEFGGATFTLQPGLDQIFRRTVDGVSVSSSEYWTLTVEFETPQSVDTARDHARKLQDLVTFIAGHPAGLNHIVAHTSKVPGTPVNVFGFSPASYDFHQPQEPGPSALVRPDEVPFADCLEQWYSISDTLDTVIAHLVNRYYYPHIPLENHVVAVVSTAELLFSRLGLPKEKFPPEAYDGMLSTIRKALAEDSKYGSLTGEFLAPLQNTKPLHARLVALADRLGDDVRTAIFASSFEEWLKAIKRARNDLAHEGTTDRYTHAQLRAISEAMNAVLTLTVLEQLGANSDVLVEAARRRYIGLDQRIAHHFPVANENMV